MSVITLLRFEIEAVSPFAIAAPERAAATDLPVAADPDGRAFVPVTSLAGSLRHHLRQLGTATSLLGSEPPHLGHGASDDAGLVPSRLRLLGTRLVDPDGGPVDVDDPDDTSIRIQTAIDRHSGAAAAGTLRSQQVLPAGCRVTLYARVDDRLAPDEVNAIAAWEPTLGGSRTRGLGRARLASLRLGVLDLGTAEGLSTWLQLGGPDLIEHVATDVVPLPDGRDNLLLSAEFRIKDSIHQGGAPPDGNRIPTYRRPDGTLALEGSTLKGILRSRAEFLLRSIDVPAAGPLDRRPAPVSRPADDVDNPDHEVDGGETTAAPLDPITLLFGSAERRGCISVREAKIHGGATRWQSHVSIDRFTGGATEGRLFTTEVIDSGTFTLEIEDHGASDLPWAVDLLRWVITDLHHGFVGVGAGTTRGGGRVELCDDSLLDDLSPLTTVMSDWSAP